MTTIIRAFDAASEHFPAGTQYAIPYVDGNFAATHAQVAHIPHLRWNTVLGGTQAAHSAGCSDFEPGNAAFENRGALRAWAEERKAMDKLARCYTSFGNLQLASERLAGLPNVLWWIATLDGNERTPDQLAARAAQHFGVTIAPGKIWAQQWRGGITAAFDTSDLFLPF